MNPEFVKNYSDEHAAPSQWDILSTPETQAIKSSTFGPEEDIQRETIYTRELSDDDFNSPNTVDQELIKNATDFITDRLQKNRYDSLPIAEWINKNADGVSSLNKLDADEIYRNTTGDGTCVQMAQALHDFYARNRVKSFFVPFQTKGQVNQAGHRYNPFGHLACIAPFIENNQKHFLLLDQALCISQPIIFNAQENSDIIQSGEKSSRLPTTHIMTHRTI